MAKILNINRQESYRTINWVSLLLVFAVLLNFTGLFITILWPDSALYASIAKTMAQRNNFIELFTDGNDWLDKPHFPFWVTAVSFKLFGFHAWSYKLPAILFLMMGARYTYLLAKDLYNKEVAIWSAIILLTAEHIIISNNDVRAEPFLTGLVIASVYHFHKIIDRTIIKHLVAGSLFAAAAVMTKGVFALIPIGGAIAGGLLLEKKWRQLFHIRWFIALVFISLFILPELYCLWYQFDQHPEKVVYGHTNVSGLKFFLWDSQFGRFTNTGPIRGKGDLLFFFHTLLWAFLPWSVLLYAALFRKIKSIFKKNDPDAVSEWFTISGALITFLLFSLSKFQLPHYTNIIFPFFSILLAHYILSITSVKTIKINTWIQGILMAVLLLLGTFIQLYFYPAGWIGWVLILIACMILYFQIFRYKQDRVLLKICQATAGTAILLNLFLNIIFYPALLKYQAGSEAAFYINKNYPGEPVLQYTERSQTDLGFYLNEPLVNLTEADMQTKSFSGIHFLYLSRDDAKRVTVPYVYIMSFRGYPVSRITWKFFNHNTRDQELKEYWLIRI